MQQDPHLHLTLGCGPTATAELREAVEAISRHVGLTDEECFELKLAATEALTNALKGTPEPHTVEVALTVDEGAVEVEVCDRGVFSPLRASLHRGPEAEGGRGVAMMLALVDDVEFRQTEEGTKVRLRKRTDSARAPLRLAG